MDVWKFYIQSHYNIVLIIYITDARKPKKKNKMLHTKFNYKYVLNDTK